MPELRRPVGLGLAARGDVQETIDWVVRAEQAGLEAAWIHDSYFERDPISFLAPMAQATKRIRLGAGALNPYTRHPFVVASTMATLDNLAEGRLSLALGSGLPLRLAQMDIPFENAPARVGESIDQIRTLWRGERLVLNDKVPPLVPMFPPRSGSRSTSPRTPGPTSSLPARRPTATWLVPWSRSRRSS